MINGLREWLLTMIAAAIIWAILETVLPKSAAGAVTRAGGGLVMLLVLLQPLMTLIPQRAEWKYENYLHQIEEKIEEYRAEGEAQMADIIQQETGAYISEKAAEMGISCHARVETAVRDGVPYPYRVVLDTKWNEELSFWLERELDIAAEQQSWEGG